MTKDSKPQTNQGTPKKFVFILFLLLLMDESATVLICSSAPQPGETSGTHAEQVPVDQLPGKRQRGEGHQRIVDASHYTPEASSPRQQGTDDHTHGQDRGDERQDELG